MSKNHSSKARQRVRRSSPRRLSVRGVVRREPNLQKIANTLAALALANAEKAAQQEHEHKEPRS